MDAVNERLDEFDKVEWFDVARKFRPELTWEEFEAMWRDFVEMKQEHERQQKLN